MGVPYLKVIFFLVVCANRLRAVYDQALTAANFRHEGYIYLAPFMAPIATRRRNAITKPQLIWPGSERLTSSKNTYVADSVYLR
jgi:hypothetical protein